MLTFLSDPQDHCSVRATPLMGLLGTSIMQGQKGLHFLVDEEPLHCSYA